MTKWGGCYTEEQLVDLVLNNAPIEQQLAFSKHSKKCPKCQALASEWQEMLVEYKDASPATTGNLSSSSNMSTINTLLESSDWDTSQERVRGQVWFKLQGTLKQKWLTWLRPKPVVAVGILGIFLCFAALLKLHPFPANQTDSWNKQHLVEEQPFYYVVSSTTEPLVDGYVSINPATEEVYIFVQGVPTVINRDYQAWLMEEKSPIDMGVLRLENGAAELYKQAKEVKKASTFKISIEPKGGSAYPTGPDFIFIRLDSQ